MRPTRLRGDGLFERVDELKAEKAGFAYHILPQDSGNDRRSYAGRASSRSNLQRFLFSCNTIQHKAPGDGTKDIVRDINTSTRGAKQAELSRT